MKKRSAAVAEIAHEVSDAMADGLLRHFEYWPNYPTGDHLMTVGVGASRALLVGGHDGGHVVAEVGTDLRSGAVGSRPLTFRR